jgi:hypothetical protein
LRSRLAPAGALILALQALGGCAGDGSTTVVVTAPVERSVTTTVVRVAKAARQVPRKRYKNCDGNIRARIGTTSCAFAQNVFYGFWEATRAGDDAFRAYSPVTGREYAMSCSAAAMVVCRAGDGGEVRFPQAAVDAYTADAAAAYRCAHQVDAAGSTCDDDATAAAAAAPAEPSAPGDCDPSYEGACLDPNASDYDCAGGSGDGPEYTGTVSVVGDDHFDLDRDGNGVGCES